MPLLLVKACGVVVPDVPKVAAQKLFVPVFCAHTALAAADCCGPGCFSFMFFNSSGMMGLPFLSLSH